MIWNPCSKPCNNCEEPTRILVANNNASDKKVDALVEKFFDNACREISMDEVSSNSVLWAGTTVAIISFMAASKGKLPTLPKLLLTTLFTSVGTIGYSVISYCFKTATLPRDRISFLISEHLANHPNASEKDIFSYVVTEGLKFEYRKCNQHTPMDVMASITSATRSFFNISIFRIPFFQNNN